MTVHNYERYSSCDYHVFMSAVFTETPAGQCNSVIVGTEDTTLRRGHKCCADMGHKGKHECAHQEWSWDKRYSKWRTAGNLTLVVFVDDLSPDIPANEKFLAKIREAQAR